MASRLAAAIEDRDDVSLVTLSGVIDEDNDLSEITARIQKQLVAISTANVERINSCGVRDWVTWLGELERAGKSIYLLECPPVIMAQVNLVHNFVGSGTIVNFYGPYFCSKCDTDRLLLIQAHDAIANLPFKAPICRCNACDLTMEFDDIESSYFAFLGQLKERPVDGAALEKVRRVTGSVVSLRSRSVSMAMPTLTPSSHTGSVPSFTPTLPSAGEFRSLLSDPEPNTKSAPPTSNKLLYLVLGLLAIAIALLGLVVMKVQ